MKQCSKCKEIKNEDNENLEILCAKQNIIDGSRRIRHKHIVDI